MDLVVFFDYFVFYYFVFDYFSTFDDAVDEVELDLGLESDFEFELRVEHFLVRVELQEQPDHPSGLVRLIGLVQGHVVAHFQSAAPIQSLFFVNVAFLVPQLITASMSRPSLHFAVHHLDPDESVQNQTQVVLIKIYLFI